MSDVIAEFSFVATSHGIVHGAPPFSHIFPPESLVLGSVGASKGAPTIFHADMEVTVVDIAIGVSKDTVTMEFASSKIAFVLVAKGIDVATSTFHRVLAPAPNVARSVDIGVHTVPVALVVVPFAFVGIARGILVGSLATEGSGLEVAFVLVAVSWSEGWQNEKKV